MAVTHSVLVSGNDTASNSTTYTTASFTPTANKLLIAAFFGSTSGSIPIPTVTGNGLTWTLIDQTSSAARTAFLYRAVGASPSAGGLTFDFGAQVITGAFWAVLELTGAVISGTNGSDGVTNNTSSRPASATSISEAFPNTVTSGNATVGLVGLATNNSPAAGTGWTSAYSANHSSPTNGFLLEFAGTAQQNITASWTTAANPFVVGVEINAASGTSGSGTLALTGSGTAGFTGSGSTGSTLALTGSGTATFAGTATTAGTLGLSGSGAAGFSGEGSSAIYVPSSTGHQWVAFSRTTSFAPDVALPIVSAYIVKRHLGVSRAILVTDYTAERWNSLQPSRGLMVYRDGVVEFTGLLVSRELEWDKTSGQKQIRVEAEGEEARLARRLVFPDPLRAADDQTVNDYWLTRTAGVATAKPASTAMYQLISDQAGATALAARRIPGIVLGADPAVGTSRIWQGLFTADGTWPGVLGALANIAVASGQNLGLRATAASSAITYTVVVPRNLSGSVKFSADLNNLVGFSYREQAPTVTDALVAGQGDLHLRTRKYVGTTDPLQTRWADQYWSYIDRRDTASTTDLTNEANDQLAEGAQTVALSVTLRDSTSATYGRDYDIGDIVTVYVGFAGETKLAELVDVIREITLEVDQDGVETITPAIGTYDAQALFPSAAQRRLSAVERAVQRLISNK